MQEYRFHVKGMHCAACVVLTEGELKKVPGVVSAKSDLASLSVQVSGDFAGKDAQEVAEQLTSVLRPYGYELLVEPSKHDAQLGDFAIAVPAALVFMAAFMLLQRSGIIGAVSISEVTYGSAFVVGLIASVSTCMAVVGGVVLSLSANFAKNGDRFRPQILFHVSRLVAFFLLGGVIGLLGSAFQLSVTATLVLNVLVAIVLLVLGINLLDVFPWVKRLQVSMPKAIGAKAHAIKDLNHAVTPLLAGIATFFLPCGFTQAMQLYALSSGNFFAGGLTMLSFALGTLPMLALLSFGPAEFVRGKYSGVAFKSAGLIVVCFAIINLWNALAIAGILSPLSIF